MDSFLRFLFVGCLIFIMSFVTISLFKNHQKSVRIEVAKTDLEGQRFSTIVFMFGDQIYSETRRDIIHKGYGDVIIKYDGSYFKLKIKDFHVSRVTRVRSN